MCDTRTCAAMAHVRVSIPNWCELEVRLRNRRGRFNSKLVRLKADTRTCAAVAHVRASIPNWCELEV